MRSASIVLFLGLAVLGSACEVIESGDQSEPPPPLTQLPRALTAEEQSLIRGSNDFAFGFLREVDAAEAGSNVFISPLSASMALAMTLNGAAGETQDEMRTMLGFGDLSVEEMNASYRSLIDLLLDLDDAVEMRIANALWLREGTGFHESFLATTRDYFDATASVLDFGDPASVDVINDWVNRSTNGRIESILDEISQDAMLYLMNAIYFKGSWTHRFDAAQTAPAPFRHDDGTTHDVQLMSEGSMPASFAFLEDASVLELPYGRDAFALTIVLPPEGSMLAELVAGLTPQRWDTWLGALRDGEIAVYLPKFTLEYERSLNGPLQALGMRRAFDPTDADFSALSPDGDDMYVHEVKQKTFLNVDEEGTEAAAVTSVEVRVTSAPPSFRVDRPFLMVIRERLSGTILFAGAIGNPTNP
ncbi:MAG TPA: serpin family protein [Rhodothermales bacterium]